LALKNLLILSFDSSEVVSADYFLCTQRPQYRSKTEIRRCPGQVRSQRQTLCYLSPETAYAGAGLYGNRAARAQPAETANRRGAGEDHLRPGMDIDRGSILRQVIGVCDLSHHLREKPLATPAADYPNIYG
jgi:hypothetical protein